MRPAASGRRDDAVRIVRRRVAVAGSAGRRAFAIGDVVCSQRQVRNDGTYPHRDIGEILVREGDLGIVQESWCFLGEVYYTVEFCARAVVAIMRARELATFGKGAAGGADRGGTNRHRAGWLTDVRVWLPRSRAAKTAATHGGDRA